MWKKTLKAVQLSGKVCNVCFCLPILLQALTGRAQTYGLEVLNLPEEVVDSLETEEDLRKALGMVEDEETVIVNGSEEVEEQGEQEVQEQELQEINLDKP